LDCFTFAFTFTRALHFFDKQTQVAEIIFKNAQGIEIRKGGNGGNEVNLENVCTPKRKNLGGYEKTKNQIKKQRVRTEYVYKKIAGYINVMLLCRHVRFVYVLSGEIVVLCVTENMGSVLKLRARIRRAPCPQGTDSCSDQRV
jgi:hypothetical protein